LSAPGHIEDAVPVDATPGQGALAAQERSLLQRTMESTGGNQSEAARILRIGRDALRYKLKKYNLDASGPGAAR
jgi:DNA-binding NtrC family response regulator